MRESKLLVDSLLRAITQRDLLHLRCLVCMLLCFVLLGFFLLLSLLLLEIRTAGGGGIIA